MGCFSIVIYICSGDLVAKSLPSCFLDLLNIFENFWPIEHIGPIK